MSTHAHRSRFAHAAAFYDGEHDFPRRMLPFVHAGLEADQPVLVMVPGRNLEALRDALADVASEVEFVDMTEVGANPGLIINAWREFATRRSPPGRRVRGIGEPIWAGRTRDELAECQRHEELLNLAFAGRSVELVCPYDETALEPSVLEAARRSHPLLLDSGGFADCADYMGADAVSRPFEEPLPDPPPNAAEIAFDARSLDEIRELVMRRAADAGLSDRRREEIVLAVNELVSNTVRHAGGEGVLSIWKTSDELIAEVRDGGQIPDPLVGRSPASAADVGGHGLWIANNLCSLMQIRSSAAGTAVRLHFRRPRAARDGSGSSARGRTAGRQSSPTRC